MSDQSIDKPIPKPATGKQGQEITYYQEDGIEMRKYTNSGVIQRWNGSKWVFAPGTAKMTITPEYGSQIAKDRWAEYKEAAMLGLMDATGTEIPNDAVRKLTQVYANHSIAGGRGGAAYADKVIQLAELARPKQQNIELREGDRSVSAPPEWIERILRLARASREDAAQPPPPAMDDIGEDDGL